MIMRLADGPISTNNDGQATTAPSKGQPGSTPNIKDSWGSQLDNSQRDSSSSQIQVNVMHEELSSQSQQRPLGASQENQPPLDLQPPTQPFSPLHFYKPGNQGSHPDRVPTTFEE